MKWRIRSGLAAALLIPALLQGQTPEATAPPFRIERGTFVALRVSDLAGTAEWYASAFHLTEVNRIEAEDGRYAIRILEGSGLTVELIRQRGTVSREEPSAGLFKVGFHVDDLDALHRWLLAKGVEADERIFLDEALGVRSFVFRDPEGNRLQAFGR